MTCIKLVLWLKERLMGLVRIALDSRTNRESTRSRQFTREAGVPADMWAETIRMLILLYSEDSSPFFTQSRLQDARESVTSKCLIHGILKLLRFFFFISMGTNR